MKPEDPDEGSPDRDEEPNDDLRARFDPLCRRAMDLAYRLTVQAVGHHTAEDIGQDVAWALWNHVLKNPGFLDDPAAVDAWVATVARRAAINDAVAQNRRDARQLEFAEGMERLRWRAMHPEFAALSQERRDTLDAALRRMPPRRREVFLAVREEGMSHAQAGARFGIRPETVHRHVSQVLADLRDALAGFREPEADPLWRAPARRRRTSSNEENEGRYEGQEGDDD
jgi:RNA polymerase sigma factor (sigma-70 family)